MRRGYIFTIDALIAVVLLSASILILVSQISKPQTDYFTDRMAADVIAVLSHTKTTDLCTLSPCDCAQYPDLEVILCSPSVRNKDASILGLYGDALENGGVSAAAVENSIHELFIESNVIDESRFGLALLYTAPNRIPPQTTPLELYNSDTYPAVTP